MAVSAEYKEYLRDQFAEFGPVDIRRMFGGAGVFADDVMIALVAYETLYLRIDDQTRAAFEAEGCQPFVYDGKGKPIEMPYMEAPGEALDDPSEMARWAELALGAARRAKAAKKPKKAGSKPRTRKAKAGA